MIYNPQKSIILGAIDMLSWTDIAPWVKSIREVGFNDEIWIIAYRISDPSLNDFLKTYKIGLYQVDHTPYNSAIQHQVANSPTVSHNMRFYHFWELLTRLLAENYKWCIATDVRDVVFQRNPIEYLDENLHEMQILAPSEGLTYENEEWGQNNMLTGYGQIFYELEAKKKQIYNVGTIAGDANLMKWLFHTIYSMTEGRPHPSDQSSFNNLITGLLASFAVPVSHDKEWACQCGTTADPTKSHLWSKLNERQPIIKDGKAYTFDGKLYNLLHQYDRNPELKQIINQKYRSS